LTGPFSIGLPLQVIKISGSLNANIDIIQLADGALYAAKSKGKHQRAIHKP